MAQVSTAFAQAVHTKAQEMGQWVCRCEQLPHGHKFDDHYPEYKPSESRGN